jgi:hypothetical protein
MTKTRICLCALGVLFLSSQLLAVEGPEDYRLELSVALWRMNSSGLIRGDGTPINLVGDLGAQQRQRRYDGRVVFKFRRKQRFVLEAVPISMNGLNTLHRNVTYFGDEFSVSETLKSSAHIDEIYGGFHHDWVSGSMGRFGSSIGGAYLGLAGSIDGEQSGLHKQNSQPFGLPLAGLDFRLYLIPHKRWIALEGALRGLPAGAYGHWVQCNGGVDGWIGPVGLQLGYRETLIDFHQSGVNPNGVNVRFSGPMAALVWKW